MLSWVSSPLSREISSSRCLRVTCAPSSAARSCWSWPWPSSHSRRSHSRAARASARRLAPAEAGRSSVGACLAPAGAAPPSRRPCQPGWSSAARPP
jgi:hypothetical protein